MRRSTVCRALRQGSDSGRPGAPSRRLLADLLDLGVVAIPIVIGWYLVDSLATRRAAASRPSRVRRRRTADRGGPAGVESRLPGGQAGTTVGKGWCSLVTRDAATVLRRSAARAAPTAMALVRRRGGPRGDRPRRRVHAGRADSSLAAVRRRRLLGLAVLAALLVLVLFASVAVGARPLSFAEVFHALFSSTDSETDIIVHTLRIPRTLLGLVVGIALGVAGALDPGTYPQPARRRRTARPQRRCGLPRRHCDLRIRPHRAEPVPVVRFRGIGARLDHRVRAVVDRQRQSQSAEPGARRCRRRVLPPGHDQRRRHPRSDHARRLPLLGRGLGRGAAASTSSGRCCRS